MYPQSFMSGAWRGVSTADAVAEVAIKADVGSQDEDEGNDETEDVAMIIVVVAERV